MSDAGGARLAGRFVFLEAEELPPRELEIEGAEVWVHAARSPNKSSPNEDAVAAWELASGSIVLAIADGLGGTPSGAKAAAVAMEALDRACAELPDEPGDLRGPILDAIEAANAAILELGLGAGTTLVVAELCGSRLRIYHVGDSAAFVVGQRGRLKLETLAHSPVGYGVAAGLIDPDLALDRADRHYIANHLGSADMHIQVGSPISLSARDTVLLASDGVLDNLLPQEILDTIRTGPLRKKAKELARLCEERMAGTDRNAPSKPDDRSFVLFREAKKR